jgi:predicted O-methyltransferase YrrM
MPPALPIRTTYRRIWLGLRTLLSARPGGFFIPYRYAGSVTAPDSYPVANALCEAAHADFRQALAMLEEYRRDLLAIASDATPPAPRWRQDWFAPLDAAILYAFIRARRPGQLIEIGCGHSTRFAAQAIADGRLATRHIAIDPAPRAEIGALRIDLRKCVLAEADHSMFGTLRAGDMLFIDSSHILMPGTDVDQLFNRVLPLLAPGVLVHVHDIFLPEDYPASWAWRGYNEQSALLPFLSGNAFRLVFASHYVTTRLASHLAAGPIGALPKDVSAAPATSFWLERR